MSKGQPGGSCSHCPNHLGPGLRRIAPKQTGRIEREFPVDLGGEYRTEGEMVGAGRRDTATADGLRGRTVDLQVGDITAAKRATTVQLAGAKAEGTFPGGPDKIYRDEIIKIIAGTRSHQREGSQAHAGERTTEGPGLTGLTQHQVPDSIAQPRLVEPESIIQGGVHPTTQSHHRRERVPLQPLPALTPPHPRPPRTGQLLRQPPTAKDPPRLTTTTHQTLPEPTTSRTKLRVNISSLH